MAEEKLKSHYQKQIEGGHVTLKFLKVKAAEIKRRQEELLKKASQEEDNKEEGEKDEDLVDAEFEGEDVRGFSDGGASTEEDTLEDLEAQLEALQEQEDLIKAQQALNEIFDEALKNGELENERDDGKGGASFKCASGEDAKSLATAIAAQYESIGIACSIVISEKSITVIVHLTEKFKDRNPLSMSPSELKEASEEAALERESETPSTSLKPTLGKWTGMVNSKRTASQENGKDGQEAGELVR